MPDEKEKQRLARIAAQKSKLTRHFSKIEPKTKKMVASLIENAAFMIVTLEDLQADVNLKGIISEYKNGANQFGTKKSPQIEVYNAMIKNHMSIMKQLTDLLPKPDPDGGGGSDDDGFDAFVNRKNQ